MLSHDRWVHIEAPGDSCDVIECDEALMLAWAHTEVLARVLLFGGTLYPDDRAIKGALGVEAFYLQFVEFYEELLYEIVEDVIALAH